MTKRQWQIPITEGVRLHHEDTTTGLGEQIVAAYAIAERLEALVELLDDQFYVGPIETAPLNQRTTT